MWLVYVEVLVKSSSSADEQRASNVGESDVQSSNCLWVLFEALYSPITMLIATGQEPSEIQKRRVKTCVKLKTSD